MNQLSPRLARALEKAKLLSPEEQDAAAAVIEGLAQRSIYNLSAEEEADLEKALDEARRSDFASDAEVAEVMTRHGL